MFRSYGRRKRVVRILLECFLVVLASACLSLTEACFEGPKVIVKTRTMHSSRMRTACFSMCVWEGGVRGGVCLGGGCVCVQRDVCPGSPGGCLCPEGVSA